MQPLLLCIYLPLSCKILRPLRGRENIYCTPIARADEIWYTTLILNGGIGQRVGKVATATAKEKGVKKMKKSTNTGLPKGGSVSDLKRQIAFENRTISPLKAIAEGVVFAVMFAAFVIACAVM